MRGRVMGETAFEVKWRDLTTGQEDELAGNWTPDAAESALAQLPDLADTSHMLRVSASGDSWIEIIDGNGTSLEMDLLRAGAERDYEGVAPFRVLLGRSSAVKLYLNGRQVDVSEHTIGNVTQMSVDGGFPGQVLEEGQDRGS